MPPRLHPSLLLIPAFVAITALTGCSSFQTTGSSAVAGVAMNGKILGGQSPITGSRIFLYAAGTGGYGSASTSLLSTSAAGVATNSSGSGYVTSDAAGNFSITNDYTCPSADSQVYLLATGGNPGLTPGTDNDAISLIAAIGRCSRLQPTTNIFISELSTVAAVTALQQFMADSTHIGTSSTNTAGLAVAFASVEDMVGLASGTARTAPAAATGVVPQAELHTLGNILAPCVNSASSGSGPCTMLRAAANSGGSAAVNVADLMLRIALSPGRNVITLFGLTNAQAPFQPSLTTQPNDFTVGVTYTGGGLLNPGSVVIDSSGNAWTANCPSCNGANGTDSIVGFGPQGAVLSGASGFTTNIHKTQGLAFDTAGMLWSVNDASGVSPDQIVKMSTSTGAVAAGFPYASASLGLPLGIAIDAQNSAWVANRALSSVVKITPSGTLAYAPTTSANFTAPTGIGIDGAGIIYAAGTGSNTILKLNGGGTVLSVPPYTGGGISQPVGISIDHFSNVFTVDNGTNAISEISGTTGTPVSPSTGYTPSNGIYQAAVIAIDGAGTAWISNCRIGCPGSGSTAKDNILHITASGVNIDPSDGLENAQFSTVGTVAIDASGNLWVSNNQGGSLTKLVGVAVPVRTPLALGTAFNQLGVRP